MARDMVSRRKAVGWKSTLRWRVLLVLIALLSGWIAGMAAGRRKGLYMGLDVGGALVLPFLLAALGVGLLAAGGLVAILIAALVGAVVVKVLFD